MTLKERVTKARDLSPTQGSLTVLAGPPGLGKSWVCGTMAEYLDPSEVLVIATLPREVNSVQYQKHNLDTILVTDESWEPSLGKKGLQATGFDELTAILRELRTDTQYKGIILDNGTQAAELAWHAALEPLGVSDPTELGRGGNRFAPYTSIREKMEQMFNSLSLLTGKTGVVKQPKLIAIPWHVQPPKETTGDEDSADEKSKGAEYEGDFLPMVRGSFRRRLSSLVDIYLYVNLETIPNPKNPMKSSDHYVVQIVTDKERHCKLPGVLPPSDSLTKGKFLDVHGQHDAWRQIMNIIETLEPEPEDN